MRRAILTIAGTVTGLVLLLSFKTTSPVSAGGGPVTSTKGSASGSSSTSRTTRTPDPAGAAATTASSPPTTATVTGRAADTQYGPVQVQITVRAGKVLTADAIVFPQGGGQDQQINSYAVPILNAEAAKAGNANIDMVSGATYTSDGYVTSLQSALDKARIRQ